MTVQELNNVCADCYYIMSDENSGSAVSFYYGGLVKAMRSAGVDTLEVKEVYADYGVNAQLKFNKKFFKIAKTLDIFPKP